MRCFGVWLFGVTVVFRCLCCCCLLLLVWGRGLFARFTDLVIDVICCGCFGYCWSVVLETGCCYCQLDFGGD